MSVSEKMQQVSVEQLADMIEGAECVSQIDLGPTLMVHCTNSVTGDFIAVSTSEGACAIINL